MLRINSVALLILLACLYFNAYHVKAIEGAKTNKLPQTPKSHKSSKTDKPVKPSAPAFDTNPSLDKLVYVKCRYSKCKREDKERMVPRNTTIERIRVYNELMSCLTLCSNEVLESPRELKQAHEFYYKKYKEIFNDMYK